MEPDQSIAPTPEQVALLALIAERAIELNAALGRLATAVSRCGPDPDYETRLHWGVRSGRTIGLLRRAKRAVDQGIKNPHPLIAAMTEEIRQLRLTLDSIPQPRHTIH